MTSRQPDRKLLFKATIDTEHGRRRREETVKQIRKNKKEDQLMKRRQNVTAVPEKVEKVASKRYTVDDIPELMDIFKTGTATPEELLEAVRGIRRMLSVESNPPVSEVLEAGSVPYLVSYLKMEHSMLVFEAAWALTNIASTNRTKDVVEGGAVPSLVHLLRHPGHEIREQAAWCLGNISGDCCELRDYVIGQGALDGLILNINEPATSSLLNNVTWAVSNLCRGKPSPQIELIESAIQPIANLFSREVSTGVIVDAVWALSYLADGEDERIQKVMETLVTPKLVEFLSSDNTALVTPTVRCLGNFVTGTDYQTQAVIDAGFLPHALHLLENSPRNIKKETCWLLSNIAAGTMEQVDALLQVRDLLEMIVKLAVEGRWEIRREAIWVLSNIFTTGTDFHVRGVIQRDGLQAISLALTVDDSKILMVAMEALEKILEVGDKLNLGYTDLVDQYQGITRLEDLQHHENESVYLKAVEIIERYFGVEDEVVDENIAPSSTDGGTFSFGIASKQLFPSENDYCPPQTDLQQNSPALFRVTGGNMDADIYHQ